MHSQRVELALTSILFVFASLAPARSFAEETIRISTGATIQESVFSKVEGPFLKETGIKLVYVDSPKPSFPERLKVMLDGKADTAVASLSFEDWVKACKAENIEVPPDITHRVIGKDSVTIIAHKSCGLKKLSTEQVAGIFTGEKKNCKDVGGADQPITIMLAADKAPGRVSFTKLVLDSRKISGKVEELKTNQEMIKKVDVTPGAVAFITTENKMPNTVEIDTPPIGRPATLATKGRPSPNVEKLIAFIRKNSQSLKLGN